MNPQEEKLLNLARDAQKNAICPYSQFPVGAAIEDANGQIWTGTNIENASYNLGLCAERVALFYALAHGARDFIRIAVVTNAASPTPPCGSCRQILYEFAPQATLLLQSRAPTILRYSKISELLPHAFSDDFLR